MDVIENKVGELKREIMKMEENVWEWQVKVIDEEKVIQERHVIFDNTKIINLQSRTNLKSTS